MGPVLIGFAGVLVAAVATGMLVGLCVRRPRLDLILWTVAMVGLAVLLNGWAILRLRVWNPSGEPIIQREQIEDEDIKDRARAHATALASCS